MKRGAEKQISKGDDPDDNPDDEIQVFGLFLPVGIL
jgi:hypothetical protein